MTTGEWMTTNSIDKWLTARQWQPTHYCPRCDIKVQLERGDIDEAGGWVMCEICEFAYRPIDQIGRLEQLAREAHALSERLCSLDEQAHEAGDDKRRAAISLVWYRNCHRMWRRLSALQKIGHTGPLW